MSDLDDDSDGDLPRPDPADVPYYRAEARARIAEFRYRHMRHATEEEQFWRESVAQDREMADNRHKLAELYRKMGRHHKAKRAELAARLWEERAAEEERYRTDAERLIGNSLDRPPTEPTP